MQRAPGEERLFRVPYGDGEIDFMLQPWFDIDVVERHDAAAPAKRYDIVVAGTGSPHDTGLFEVSRAVIAICAAPLVRDGGAIVVAARLDEGAGEDPAAQAFLDAIERAESAAALVARTGPPFPAGVERAVALARVLERCMVVVAASEAPEVARLAKLRAAVDVEEGLDIAYEHIGRPQRASVLLVRRAFETVPGLARS